MNLKETISKEGWAHLHGVSEFDVRQIIEGLGSVLFETQVRPNPQSRALVTSHRPLGPHTDHHSAKLILWHCKEQSHIGGESILIDAWRIIDTMPLAMVEQLKATRLKEHAVFEGDLELCEMLRPREGGKWDVYYSFWLAGDEKNAAFQAFSRGLAAMPRIEIRLEPSDVLIIDNRRMLHGRKAIPEGANRHLTRFWIS